MKKIYQLLFISLFVFGCEDYLDVEPELSINSSSVFETKDGALAALNAIYTSLKGKGMYGTDYPTIGDAATDNGKIPSDREGSGGNSDRLPHAYLLNLNANTTSILLWQDAYETINFCNTFLESIEQVTNMSADEILQASSEVRIIRAYAHFMLMQVFSQDYNFTLDQSHLGIPIVTETGITSKPSRNTTAEVYNFILTEFNESINNIQGLNSLNRPGNVFNYINYYVALSLRAKIYFYMTDYTNALADANEVINSNQYSLIPQYTTGLYASVGLGNIELINEWSDVAIVTQESIFQLYINEGSGTTNRSLIDIYTSNNGNAAHAISADLLDLYEPTDLRRNWYKIENTDPHVFKYPGDFGAAPDDTPFSVIRLTELVLMKAEIEARNGQEIVARNLVNQITSRSNASAINSIGNQLIEDIITERRKEKAFEANRLFDLKRLQRGFVRNDCSATICDVTYPTNLYAWPIPQEEFNGNPNMVQNEGY